MDEGALGERDLTLSLSADQELYVGTANDAVAEPPLGAVRGRETVNRGRTDSTREIGVAELGAGQLFHLINVGAPGSSLKRSGVGARRRVRTPTSTVALRAWTPVSVRADFEKGSAWRAPRPVDPRSLGTAVCRKALAVVPMLTIEVHRKLVLLTRQLVAVDRYI